MWMLNLPQYNVSDVNNAALLQYGYTKEEFLNLSVFDFRPKEDIESLKPQPILIFAVFIMQVYGAIKRKMELLFMLILLPMILIIKDNKPVLYWLMM